MDRVELEQILNMVKEETLTRLSRYVDVATTVESAEDDLKAVAKLVNYLISDVNLVAFSSQVDVSDLFITIRDMGDAAVLFLGEATRAVLFKMGSENRADISLQLTNTMNAFVSDGAEFNFILVDPEVAERRMEMGTWLQIFSFNPWMIYVALVTMSGLTLGDIVSMIPEQEPAKK